MERGEQKVKAAGKSPDFVSWHKVDTVRQNGDK
jgi:hypothetical protein